MDIVERLREKMEYADEFQYIGAAELIYEAAEEIERLREALQFYADDENWKIDAPLDITSAYFTGGPARAALQQKETE